MRHAAIATLGVVLMLAGCLHGKSEDTTPARPATPKEVVAAARGAIEQWRQAYEVRSADALAKLYVHDNDTVMVQEGQPLLGWSAIEPVLRDRLGKAKEIHVRLKDMQVTSLAPMAAYAIATMTREVSDGVTTVTENGALTLVLRNDGKAWQIVAEHYSYRRPS